ncbi:putative translation elongation factor eef-1b gamma protein [Neofusicoccum parvum UCRNP2]|uniref:Putative translation elongation factor eef-1b gamma protein n=1 Tax=Botryosphaeria parva (strain UCR-NP2) TaxID=1287680 RepID=R1FYZ6_BOTPV|nr:putative translation elongation factor eef-1b gamma protein [Neofusicoccum parvum UCRNP2]
MSSIGTIWTYPFNPRAMKVEAATAVNGRTVDFVPNFAMGNTNKTPEFLASFPMGRVPTFKSTCGLALFESDAIAQYAAESGPASAQLLGATAEERAIIRQWIGFADHELFEPLTTLILWRFSLKVLEKQLYGRQYIVSEQLSLADISVAAGLYWGFAQVIDQDLRAEYSQTTEWHLRVVQDGRIKSAFGEKNFIEVRKITEIVLLRLGGMATVVGIAGLTGKFAQCVAKELQAYPGTTIKGFCRSPQKLSQKALLKYKIKVIQGEFDDEAAVQRFVRGTDIVICCYFGDPDVMTRGQKILVEACAREGVPRYLPSDFAVDYTKIPARELFPKESAKIIKDYLVEKKVAGVHVLIGGLIETFWSGFFQIYDAQTQTMAYWGTGDEKWDLTTYETAAAYTAALVTDKNAAGVFRFRGDCTSISEIKETYETIYQSPLHLKRLGSLDDLYSTAKDRFEKDPSDAMAWGPGCFAYWCTNGVASLGDDLDNKKYPQIVPADMVGFLKTHKKENIAIADQCLGF